MQPHAPKATDAAVARRASSVVAASTAAVRRRSRPSIHRGGEERAHRRDARPQPLDGSRADEWLTVAARESEGPLAPEPALRPDDDRPADQGQRPRRFMPPIAPGVPRSGRRSRSASSDLQFGPCRPRRVMSMRPSGVRRPPHRCGLRSLTWRAGVRPDVDVKQVVQVTESRRRLVRRRHRGRQEQAGPERHLPGQEDRSNDAIRPLSLNVVFKKITAARRGGLRRRLRPERRRSTGNQTAPMTVRTETGYTGDPPQSRAEMLQNSQFQDLRVVVFAKHSSSKWVELASFDIPRQLLTTLGAPVARGAQPNVRSTQRPTPPPALARGSVRFDAAAIIVSNVIGGGILFTPPQVAASVPNPVVVPGDVGGRRRARLRRRDGVRGAGGAAAARRRRVRLPARRLRPAGGVSDRLDVVRRRLLRRDRGQRRRPRGLRRPVHSRPPTTPRRSSSCRCRSCR